MTLDQGHDPTSGHKQPYAAATFLFFFFQVKYRAQNCDKQAEGEFKRKSNTIIPLPKQNLYIYTM